MAGKLRTWDTKLATQLIDEKYTDAEVAAKVGTTKYAVRLYRIRTLRITYGPKNQQRSYYVSSCRRLSYRDQLEAFIARKAAEWGMAYDDCKHWLFKTPEGVAYCDWMNNEIAKERYHDKQDTEDTYAMFCAQLPQ